jgi:hypothetical protein
MKYLLLSLVALVFASCAKDLEDAAIYQEPAPDLPPAPREAPKKPVAIDKPSNHLAKPTKPADGLRLPDMLTLPQDDQLRSASSAPKDGKATVIVRPPEE